MLSEYIPSNPPLIPYTKSVQVVNKAKINDVANGRLVEELRSEIAVLSRSLENAEQSSQSEIRELHEQLQQSRKLVEALNMSWEEKLRRAEHLKVSRENALRQEGTHTHILSRFYGCCSVYCLFEPSFILCQALP